MAAGIGGAGLEVKFGFRTPSLRKRISARTSFGAGRFDTRWG
jgi:hypothetical protein